MRLRHVRLCALIGICGLGGALAASACFSQAGARPETIGASQSTTADALKSAPTNGSGAVPVGETGPAVEASKPVANQPASPLVSAPAPAPGTTPTPGTAPTPGASAAPGARADTSLLTRPPVREGDEWIYRRFSGAGSVLLRQRIAAVSEAGISLRTEQSGSIEISTAVYNREWGLLGSGYNDYLPALGYYAFSLYPGKRWRIDSQVSNFGAGQKSRVSGEGAALAFEDITVAAGRFTALKILIELEITDPGDTERVVRTRETHWYAREVMRPVKVESMTQLASETARIETIELVSFRLE